MSSTEREAAVFGRYLLHGKEVDAQCITHYCRALELKNIPLSPKDEKIMRFILKNRRATGLIDSALALSGKKSGVRKKILIMSAILETQPGYAALFLPQERSWFYNIYIFWVGARAVMKAVAGKFLLLFL